MLRYFIILLIFILYSSSSGSSSSSNDSIIDSNEVIGVKDYSLSYLIDILSNNTSVFKDWDASNITVSNINDFINTVEPWIITTPTITSTNTPTTNSNSQLNCLNSRYSNVLTGTISKKPKILIDFIPFGYDVTKLLIRLH